jgi:hypothetical protein
MLKFVVYKAPVAVNVLSSLQDPYKRQEMRRGWREILEVNRHEWRIGLSWKCTSRYNVTRTVYSWSVISHVIVRCDQQSRQASKHFIQMLCWHYPAHSAAERLVPSAVWTLQILESTSTPGSTFRKSTFCPHNVLYRSREKKLIISSYAITLSVFSTRYCIYIT